MYIVRHALEKQVTAWQCHIRIGNTKRGALPAWPPSRFKTGFRKPRHTCRQHQHVISIVQRTLPVPTAAMRDARSAPFQCKNMAHALWNVDAECSVQRLDVGLYRGGSRHIRGQRTCPRAPTGSDGASCCQQHHFHCPEHSAPEITAPCSQGSAATHGQRVDHATHKTVYRCTNRVYQVNLISLAPCTLETCGKLDRSYASSISRYRCTSGKSPAPQDQERMTMGIR